MSARRIPMQKIRDILRLHFEGHLSRRQIARCLSISRDSVAVTLERVATSGVSWPLPEDLSDRALVERLYPKPQPILSATKRVVPDWQEMHDRLKVKHVTRHIVWDEFRQKEPDAVRYSQFCLLYRQWQQHVDPVMRQTHKAGEKLFVDFAGDTVPVVNPETGEIREAQLFVAVLGCSKYLYAEATWTQSLPDWVMAHVRAFHAIGGVCPILIPDNTRTAVKKPCWYEPTLNRTYAEMASWYGTAILPARVRKPKDKPVAEGGVLLAERAVLGRLRNRTFFSLESLNEAIAEEVEKINEAPFQKLDGSRRSQFEAHDRPALLPLPAARYEYAEWSTHRAGADYHIEVDKHYYSVPFRLMRHQLDVRLTATTVEAFCRNERVASHRRSARHHAHTTLHDHMPDRHRHYAEWTPERIVQWAASVGGSTAEFCEAIMARRRHPEQGFRACLGIMRLSKTHGTSRVDAACRRALVAGAIQYKSIVSILARHLDELPLFPPTTADPLPDHEHLRGPQYYN